jgi:hypothetical protein
MMEERETSADARPGRLWPHPVLAAALGAVALLLFCWPFVRVPRPTLPAAFLHMFGSWTAAIGLLWWISRGFGRGSGGPGGDRDG